MNHELRTGFSPFLNQQDLRSAIESVCAKYGKVTHLDILPAQSAAGLQCTCLLRLDSSEAESKLRSKLNVISYGPDLLFFAEVDDKWTGPRS